MLAVLDAVDEVPDEVQREIAGMSSMTRMRPPGASSRRRSASTAADVVVGEVVEQAEDQDLVEAAVGQVDACARR